MIIVTDSLLLYCFHLEGGASFGDNDLFDISDNDNYKPDPGKGGGGGGRTFRAFIVEFLL